MCCEKVGTRDAGTMRVHIDSVAGQKKPVSPIVLGIDGSQGLLWGAEGIVPSWDAGNAVSLTLLEARLAWFLLFHAGKVHSYSDLLEHVWEYPRGTHSQAVYTGLSRLSRKSRDAGLKRWWKVRHGFGYWVDGRVLDEG